MQATPSRDTRPETRLRSALHNKGLRFRKDVAPDRSLRCKVDVVFTRAKVCVFVDGCFWHGCQEHFTTPKVNTGWWLEKIQDNVLRDHRQTRALKELGWTVLRFWEHEMTDDGIQGVVQKIEKAVHPS